MHLGKLSIFYCYLGRRFTRAFLFRSLYFIQGQCSRDSSKKIFTPNFPSLCALSFSFFTGIYSLWASWTVRGVLLFTFFKAGGIDIWWIASLRKFCDTKKLRIRNCRNQFLSCWASILLLIEARAFIFILHCLCLDRTVFLVPF